MNVMGTEFWYEKKCSQFNIFFLQNVVEELNFSKEKF